MKNKKKEFFKKFYFFIDKYKQLFYKEWRKFENVINKAKKACKNTGISEFDHFVGADKMVQIGSDAKNQQNRQI